MQGRLPLAFALSVALVAGVAFFSHEDEPHAHVVDGDPQDPPRRRDHAGEPLLRLLLRHVPGSRRPAAAQRALHRLLAGSPQRDLLLPVPRRPRPQQRRPARAPRRGPRHQRREDERLRAPGQARAGDRLRRQPGRAPVLVRRGAPGRDGLPRRARDPELLGLRAPLRAAGPHVPAGHLVEPAGAPVHGLGMVGPLPDARGVELRQRDREPAGAAARAAEPDRPQADLRVDRPHLPAAQGPRLLALLRRQGRAARLRRRRHGLQAGQAKRRHARDLEPAAVVRHGQGRPRAAQHRPDEAAVRGWPSAARCRRSRG